MEFRNYNKKLTYLMNTCASKNYNEVEMINTVALCFVV